MMMDGHAAVVTGANHGIGAATAVELGRRGCAVLCTFLRVHDEVDPGVPQAYRDYRAAGADAVVEQIQAAGGPPGAGIAQEPGQVDPRLAGGRISGAVPLAAPGAAADRGGCAGAGVGFEEGES